MSKRLQVLFDDEELDEIRAIARRHGLTVSDWVRRAVRSARRQESGGDPAEKLEVIRAASRHSFPATLSPSASCRASAPTEKTKTNPEPSRRA